MKKFKIVGALLILLMSTSLTQAEDVKLEDNSSILGKWTLYAEAPALHKEKALVKIVWDFKKNGILSTLAKDTRKRTGTMSIDLKYSIEEGDIKKQSTPGREKYETCRVIEKKIVEKKGKKREKMEEMVLKCRYLHFFLERKIK